MPTNWGHRLQTEHDERINLLHRALHHLRATADYSVFYGEGRDIYDLRGRTAHECVFNTKDGHYRCPNSQQGYTGFFYLDTRPGLGDVRLRRGARVLQHPERRGLRGLGQPSGSRRLYAAGRPGPPATSTWNTRPPTAFRTGTPEPRSCTGWATTWIGRRTPTTTTSPSIARRRPSGRQGLVRLGRYLQERGEEEAGKKYFQAGLTVLDTLLDEPYLSTDEDHQGLILHSIYHHPNGWDYVPEGSKVPYGESSMWGDYHAREAALLMQRLANDAPYYTFFTDQ